ncbi:MAG: chemotaxis response regulator protein-glutamate methylesterase [Deltaproteobacteria bacterium]|nr:chemotaxis response regulator protein-glutamate methylesterase [Deltaproteobacteria bacterium]
MDIKPKNKIRVLVADDSALMRKLIPHILAKDHDIEVVATAVDGLFALKKIGEYRPDVITLDVDMPRMDGLTALKHIVAEYKTPVIMVSSLTEAGAELTLKALELGAMDFITKPHDAISVHIGDIADDLIRKIKAIAKVSPTRLFTAPRPAAPLQKSPRRIDRTANKVVAIGISTGGPNALTYLLPMLPADISAGVLIVQHMPPGFTEVFAARLNNICKIEVKEARDGDMVIPGRAIIAPGGKHIKVKKTNLGSVVIVSSTAPVNGHQPSVDVLFNSVAIEYGHDAVGVIMTGMGEDGAEGLGRIKAARGATIAQDEESCVVYGMPKVAVERGYADRIVPLNDMAGAITEAVSKDSGQLTVNSYQ